MIAASDGTVEKLFYSHGGGGITANNALYTANLGGGTITAAVISPAPGIASSRWLMRADSSPMTATKRSRTSGVFRMRTIVALIFCTTPAGMHHALHSKEYQSAALTEGFAQFYATAAWNFETETAKLAEVARNRTGSRVCTEQSRKSAA